MDKKERHDLYRFSTGPGWWPILDLYLPPVWDSDPEAELYIKEKYGLLRIGISSQKIPFDRQIEIEDEAEELSSKICEYCGRPGQLRTDRGWIKTLCDRCAADEKAGNEAEKIAEQRWLDSVETYFYICGVSGRGPCEKVLRQDITAEEEGECYLCDGHIEAGSNATILHSLDNLAPPSERGARYLLCRQCADKNCYHEPHWVWDPQEYP